MATLFQKIFLPKYKRMILDFINEHYDSVQYYTTKEPGHFITHNVYIEAEDMLLSASLRKDIFMNLNTQNTVLYSVLPSTIAYSFGCTKPCGNYECAFNYKPIVQEAHVKTKKSKFPLRLYNRMLVYYIIKNGMPDNVR